MNLVHLSFLCWAHKEAITSQSVRKIHILSKHFINAFIVQVLCHAIQFRLGILFIGKVFLINMMHLLIFSPRGGAAGFPGGIRQF